MAFADSVASLLAGQTQLQQILQGLAAQIQGSFASGGSVQFFVDPVAGLDTNIGTQASPFRTITKAALSAPQGRETIIYLPASSAAFCHLNPADTGIATGYIDITSKYLVIAPVGYTGGALAAAQTPNIVFDTLDTGAENVSAHFQGQGTVAYCSVAVQYPSRVDQNAATDYNYGAVSFGYGGELAISHFGGSVVLGTAPAVLAVGAVHLQLDACAISIAAGVAAASARLLSQSGSAAVILETSGITLPTGVSLGSLIQLPSGATIAAGASTPPGFLTTKTSW